jgi:spore maturation protein CgeB
MSRILNDTDMTISISDQFANKHCEKNVLVVTAGLPSKRCFLLDAFKDMCCTDVVFGKEEGETRIDRLLRPIGIGQVARNKRTLNDAIISAARSCSYDLICVIKGNTVQRQTIEAAKCANPNTQIVLWTPDDQALRHNQSRCFLDAAPAYDTIFTTKSNNIKYGELEDIGFRCVEFLYQAYCEHEHLPIRDNASRFKSKVIFIGYAEGARFEFMNYLALNGIRVDVYGNGWTKQVYSRRKHEKLILHGEPLLGRNYAEAISNAAINLCFLRKKNRDLHTSRTFEIPACGGFMLAERTHEHEHLFREGEEAEYFDSCEELLAKVRYYLENPVERTAIASKGYQRTRKDAYSYHHMVDTMIARTSSSSGELVTHVQEGLQHNC